MIKHHIMLFFTALSFYTRIPCSSFCGHSAAHLDRASIYFPVVGIIVGAISALSFIIAKTFFSVEIAALFSIAVSIAVTGGFHEDGFIDVCDGFGGGWTKDRILSIMKDSRVGAFGAIGCWVILSFKFLALLSIPESKTAAAMIIAHSLSRFTALSFVFTHKYSRETDDAKAKAAAQKMTPLEFCVSGIISILPLIFYSYYIGNPLPAFVVLIVFIVKKCAASFFVKWIDGYTGDCLGAVQQVSEVAVYLFMGAKFWNSF